MVTQTEMLHKKLKTKCNLSVISLVKRLYRMWYRTSKLLVLNSKLVEQKGLYNKLWMQKDKDLRLKLTHKLKRFLKT
jgi:hypothetical protein